jgi:methylated-DNA-[protein]-cysteine S-methyltransferase
MTGRLELFVDSVETPIGRFALVADEGGRLRASGFADSNPIGVVVPCHRVIGSDGSLTGYGGGIERKKWLLAHERIRVSTTETGRSG